MCPDSCSAITWATPFSAVIWQVRPAVGRDDHRDPVGRVDEALVDEGEDDGQVALAGDALALLRLLLLAHHAHVEVALAEDAGARAVHARHRAPARRALGVRRLEDQGGVLDLPARVRVERRLARAEGDRVRLQEVVPARRDVGAVDGHPVVGRTAACRSSPRRSAPGTCPAPCRWSATCARRRLRALVDRRRRRRRSPRGPPSTACCSGRCTSPSRRSRRSNAKPVRKAVFADGSVAHWNGATSAARCSGGAAMIWVAAVAAAHRGLVRGHGARAVDR